MSEKRWTFETAEAAMESLPELVGLAPEGYVPYTGAFRSYEPISEPRWAVGVDFTGPHAAIHSERFMALARDAGVYPVTVSGTTHLYEVGTDKPTGCRVHLVWEKK